MDSLEKITLDLMPGSPPSGSDFIPLQCWKLDNMPILTEEYDRSNPNLICGSASLVTRSLGKNETGAAARAGFLGR